VGDFKDRLTSPSLVSSLFSSHFLVFLGDSTSNR